MRVNKLDGMNKIWSYQAKRYDMQGSDMGGRLSGWWLPCRCSRRRRRRSRPTCSSPSTGTPPSLEGARPRIDLLQLVSSWWRLRDGSSRCTPCPAGSTWETPSPPPPCSWSPVHPLPLLGTWGPPEEAPIKHPAIQKTDFARNEKRGGGGGGRCDRERMLVPPTNSVRGVNDFGPGGSVPHTGDQDTAISVGLGATSADQRGRLLQTRFYHIYQYSSIRGWFDKLLELLGCFWNPLWTFLWGNHQFLQRKDEVGKVPYMTRVIWLYLMARLLSVHLKQSNKCKLAFRSLAVKRSKFK